MGRPYGKIPRTGKKTASKDGGGAFKIRLRSESGEQLSMQEIRDGMFEAARRLQSDKSVYRAKWVTIYVKLVDRDGNEVLPDPSGAWEIRPYKSVADDCGV